MSQTPNQPRPEDAAQRVKDEGDPSTHDFDLDSFAPLQSNPNRGGHDLDSTMTTRRETLAPEDESDGGVGVESGGAATTQAQGAGDADATVATHGAGDDGDAPTLIEPPRPAAPDASTDHAPPRARTAVPLDSTEADAQASIVTAMLDVGVFARAAAPASPGAVAVLAERYEIRRRLGEGGMGVVFLAWDRMGECEVAVKTIRPKFLGDKGACKRFIDEAKQMNKIPSHACVLVVKDFGDEKRPYYVMEYMPEGSLGRLLRRDGAMGRDEALRLAIHVAKAIEYVHVQTGQIHRDIKPENVMLSADGSARLADFGLIRGVGEGSRGLRAGTLAYMPPEIITDEGKNVGFDWDIYSFGALMYEMLTGQRPYAELFQGQTPMAQQLTTLKVQITQMPPKPIRQINRKADADLTRIAEWCMARLARNRYFSMSDVVKDLQRAEKGRKPLGPRQEAGAGAAGKAGAAFWVLTILLLAALVGGGAWVWWKDPFGLGFRNAANTDSARDAPTKDDIIANGGKDKATPPTPGPRGDGELAVNPDLPRTGNAVIDGVNPDPPFAVDIVTGQGKKAYIEEERISFEVTPAAACYLTVIMLNLDHPEDDVAVLLPNAWQPEYRVAANRTVVINSIQVTPQRAIELVIRPPHGRQLIKVFATARPLRLHDGRSQDVQGFTMLKLDQLKATVTDTGGVTPKDVTRLDAAFEPDEWATAELVVTTTAP